MFLTVIRTILWILSAGVVGYTTFLTVISNSKSVFSRSLNGNTLVSNMITITRQIVFKTIRIEYEDNKSFQYLNMVLKM
ncbi:hypothetical protein [Leptospira noguchii]|uniref:hypothetical protein n=1 Tax=Leptospira noguchii TaxID=28182 RepID=UPI001FB7382D|nr:hypothetical protein [Leptospira noguchii]UOG49065.1 hypothetical protein MAL00_01675 [Leptospira noguchii]